MEGFFNPQSIAIVGASRHPEKVGYQILHNIIQSGFKGTVYPVNPEADVIYDLQVSPDLDSIAGPIDLVIIVVPYEKVPEVLESAVRHNVPYAVIISAGFAEAGQKGKLLQEELKDVIIKTSPIRVLGPNCMGLINSDINLNATFAAPQIIQGGLSVVFQSGALASALLDLTEEYQFGLSKFVSLGNKIDIEESEIIRYLADDPSTKIIALYLENIVNLKKFFEAARYAAQKKPIVILKGGTTKKGAKAAFSHTAALINEEYINRAIFTQSNLIQAKTIDEMINIIQIVNTEPPMKDGSVGIITNAGGPAILTTDAASRVALKMPPLSAEGVKILQKAIPELTSVNNPLDLIGTATAADYQNAINQVLKEPDIASLMVILTPQASTEIEKTAENIGRFANAPKPIVASFIGKRLVAPGIDILRKYHVPHFTDPEDAMVAIKKVAKYFEKFFAQKDFIEIETNNQILEVNYDALELVQNYDINIPPSGMATNLDVTMKIAGRVGFPLVVKNVSPKIIHKFKAGKVILNVQSESYLKEAVKKVGFPVLIQKMVDSPFEVIVGAKRDEDLGLILTFGWGGIFVEDLADISTRIAPLTEWDLDEMIKETKIGKILVREGVSLSPIKNVIISVNQIMMDYPNIQEMDLNPLKVTIDQAVCVDARYK